MTSITLPTQHVNPNLRSLNILRDLPAVADLIEQCFSESMDNEGKKYIQEMRRAGNDNAFMKWATRVNETTSLPLTGYIWEENNQIVGNISLVPFRHHYKKIYLLANIAVHPNHRRKKIAYALTERAMQHLREKNIKDVWLNVRADNFGAIELYKKLGFTEKDKRNTWHSTSALLDLTSQTDFHITKRHNHFWLTQLNWLNRLYPDRLAWHGHWNIAWLGVGFWNWLYLFISDINVRQWAVMKDNQLQATLSYISQGLGKGLYLATNDGSNKEAVTELLIYVKRQLNHVYPKLSLEYPVSDFDSAIEKAGFKQTRTLIWMCATL